MTPFKQTVIRSGVTPVTFVLMMFFLHNSCSCAWSISPFNNSVSTNQSIPDQGLNRARSELEKRQYAAAVKSLTDTIKLRPDLAEAYYLRARSLDMMGQPMRALKDINKYIELKPQDPKGYVLKGDINNFNLDHREALENYSLALKLDSRMVNARVGRGLAYAALEKYDLAIKDYEEVIKENKHHHEALSNLGMALALSGRTEEAIQKLSDALALERDLDWRSRLKKLIDEISQALPGSYQQNKWPSGKAPNQIREKPW